MQTDILTTPITRADVQLSLQAMLEMADHLHAAGRIGEDNARAVAHDLGFQSHGEAVAWCYAEIDRDRVTLREMAAGAGTPLPASPSLARTDRWQVAPDRGHSFAKAKYRGA